MPRAMGGWWEEEARSELLGLLVTAPEYVGSCLEEEACGGSLGLRAIVRGPRWLLRGGAA